MRANRIVTLALGVAMVCEVSPASAEDAASSVEDREGLVSIARSLERAPLDPNLKADRAWALEWLTEAPDVDARSSALDRLLVVRARGELSGFVQHAYATCLAGGSQNTCAIHPADHYPTRPTGRSEAVDGSRRITV